METFELYKLINQKRWTEFLKSLEEGEHTFSFPSVTDIWTCKALAYKYNTDKIGKIYRFHVDKDELKVVIKVTNQ